MRIISGMLGGRRIRIPPNINARPAMARTRESLFSMLEARGLDWPQTSVLDLFAGSGSLAYEALSRGARGAVLVEKDAEQCRYMAANNDAFGLQGRAIVICQDVGRYLRNAPATPFNVVFIDPPYRHGQVDKALAALVSRSWLAQGAWVVAEIEIGAALTIPSLLALDAGRQFGQTLLQIWKFDENSTVPGDI